MSGKPSKSESELRFSRILEQYGHVLRQAVARCCPRDSGISVEEIEQEVRIRLWNVLQSEKEIHNPASYLYRIAATATIDAVRRAKARREEPLYLQAVGDGGQETLRPLPANPDQSPDRLVEQSQLAQKVAAAIHRLADNRRQAVSLHLDGWSSVEIGNLLGWTEAKARNLLNRGLEDLRGFLKDEGIDYEVD